MADIIMVSGEGDDDAGHTLIHEAIGFGADGAALGSGDNDDQSSEELARCHLLEVFCTNYSLIILSC